MTRSFHIAAALGAVSTLVACSGAEDPGSSGGTASATEDSTSDGFVFKGPMGPGGTISIVPLGPNLEPLLDADGSERVVTTEVLDWDGSYAVAIPEHQGLVEITASGAAFNEAEGAHDESKPLVMKAFGEVGVRTSVQVNLITDLTHEAMRDELRAGVPFSEAQADIIEAFYDALPFGDRPRPEVLAHELQPHDTGYDQAWLFGFSSIVAQALLKHPEGGAGGDTSAPPEPDDLFADLRADFRDDWMFSDAALDLLDSSERALNPDLAVLGLKEHHDSNATGLPVPDLHTFLDSDQDGVLNDDDNCRYVANPDQRSEDGLPFGTACDSRLAQLSVDDQWGCGITAYDSHIGPAGSVVCWEVEGAKTGGSPPSPLVFPGAENAPWGADSPFAGRDGDAPVFTDIAVASDFGGEPWICATTEPSDAGMPPTTVCWDAALPEAPVPLGSHLVDLSMSADVLCGSYAETDGAACFSRDGSFLMSTDLGLSKLAIVGDSHVCGLTADQTLTCLDRFGLPVPLPPDLDGVALADFDGNTAQGDPFGCGVVAADGRIACFDLDGGAGLAFPPVPVGAGYVEVAVGLGTTCATAADGIITCTRHEADDDLVVAGDAYACPEHGPPPGIATEISIDRCQACGIDDKGFGVCWPTNWERARGEGEPIID